MQDKIRTQLTEAMKAKDSLKLSVFRGLLSAFVNELVSKGRKPDEKLSDDDVMAVIKHAVKQRKDSIIQFRNGGREDLAAKEEDELKILETYLPAMMSEEQIKEKAFELKNKLGATDKSKMGIFMGALMKELKGQADGAQVKKIVDELFLNFD